MTSYTKNKFDFYGIEPEIRPDKVVQSVIETDLFLWKGLGNSSSRTETQKQLMKAIVDSFLTKIDIKDIILFINPDKHGVGKCGAGVIIVEIISAWPDYDYDYYYDLSMTIIHGTISIPY